MDVATLGNVVGRLRGMVIRRAEPEDAIPVAWLISPSQRVLYPSDERWLGQFLLVGGFLW